MSFIFISKKLDRMIYPILFFISSLYCQDLEDIRFGDDHSLDVATWNIEWFPKNDQTTVDYVSDIINHLNMDILAIQEVDDTVMFEMMLEDLQDYSGYYESGWFAGLAYIYKVQSIEINDIYEIYTTSPFWNAFPRSPMVMDFNFRGDNYFIINNHFKCCGDGVLELGDSSDEENRRYTAINLLKEYIDDNLYDENVIVLGDLNDDIAEELTHNIFQDILNDTENYYFADIDIAMGPDTEWSFPNWPSHLDHILLTDELFDGMNTMQTQTIKIDDYIDGGWNEYDQNISDHRPVAIKIFNFISYYDMDGDGVVDETDLDFVVSHVIEDNESINITDFNQDSVVDIFDLFRLSDFIYFN